MNDPFEQLKAAAERFGRNDEAVAPAPVIAPTQSLDEQQTRLSDTAGDSNQDAPTQAEQRAAALAGTLSGRLAALPTSSIARLITLFSTVNPKILADDRRLIVSAIDYCEKWNKQSIVALAKALGVKLTANAAIVIWERIRPARGSAASVIEVLQRMIEPGRTPTAQMVLDICRSERVITSRARIHAAAVRLGAIPTHTPREVFERAARDLPDRLEPYMVTKVLLRLGYKTDELTVLETNLYLRKNRVDTRPVVLPNDQLDMKRIAEYVGGRRQTVRVVMEAVREAHGVNIVRAQGREIAAKLRSMKLQFPLGSQTVALVQAMAVRIPGVSRQEIVHQALLMSMQSMVEAGAPGFPPALGEALEARMIRSRFNMLAPAKRPEAEPGEDVADKKKPRRR